MLGIFLDIETNGLNSYRHRSLEIAFEIVELVSGKSKGAYHAFLDQDEAVWDSSDPESLKINGLSPEKMPGAIREEQAAQEVTQLFEELGVSRQSALYICQNPSFDRAFFSQILSPDIQEAKGWPYRWLDFASMVYAQRLEKAQRHNGPMPWEGGLSKDAIAAALMLPEEKRPHCARRGVEHLLLCYKHALGFFD